MITPRTLKGFRDYLPRAMIPRERLIDTARRVYRSYGFSPIDTPALEYLEILTGKGGEETDKQLYRFKDHGGREVGHAVRPDGAAGAVRRPAHRRAGHAVQALSHRHACGAAKTRSAAAIANSCSAISTPSARFRLAADIETALVIHDLLRAIGFEEFTIHVNNRMVLNGLLAKLGLAEQSKAVLHRARQAGQDRPGESRRRNGRHRRRDAAAGRRGAATGRNRRQQRRRAAATRTARGRQRTRASGRGQTGANCSPPCTAAGVAAAAAEDRRRRSPAGSTTTPARSSKRFSTPCPTSAASAPAAGTTTWRRCTPSSNCRASARRWAWIGCWPAWKSWACCRKSPRRPVFIPYFDAARLHDYLRLAAKLRAAGIGVEVYPEPKKLGQQLKYADRRGFRAGPDRRRKRIRRRHDPNQKPRHHHQRNRAPLIRRR